MARPLRLHVPGGFYHVTLRGNHRQPIFFSDSDHERLDNIVAEALARLEVRLHAYCWMTNHLHLMVQISNVPLGRLMLRIASRYARRVQWRLETTGHLFERRYHSVLVDADAYLLTLLRYIHLNPVRAGLVADPADYPWSSHRIYLGKLPCDWVTTTFALGLLSADPGEALARYRQLFGGPDPCRWGTGSLVPNPKLPQVLGDDGFVARLQAPGWRPRSHMNLDNLVSECCVQFGVTAEQLVSASRARSLAIARAWIGHKAVAGQVASICQVARRLCRSEAAIRHIMGRHPPGASGQ